MQLQYRGVKYEYNPPAVEIEAAEVGGKYRGQTWRLQTLKRSSVQQTNQELKYRGASYRTGQPVIEPAVPVEGPESAPISIEALMRARAVQQHHALKHRHQLLWARAAAEVGLVA